MRPASGGLMCGDDFQSELAAADLEQVLGSEHGLTRRRFVTGMSAVAGGLALAPWTQVAASATSLTGHRPFVAAMHVHGSWSEQAASWESYGPLLRGLADVVFMTDHDYRALADRYWTSLDGVPTRSSFVGSTRQRAATHDGGALRLLAESSGTSPATTSIAVDDVTSKALWDKLRTSIAGHTLRHTFGACRLTNGATYEMRIALSHHPAAGTRPAGQLSLWYRFGTGLAAGRRLESSGLVGVVTRPLPAAGTTLALDLDADVAALWPGLLPFDNGFNMLSFVVRSARSGSIADVRVAALEFRRTGHDAAAIAADQRRIADTYGPRYGLTLHPASEVGRGVRHMNAYSQPQLIPDQRLNVDATRDDFYRQTVDAAHSRGGVVSWNHPFGANEGPVLSAAQQAERRRAVFSDLRRVDVYGSDLLEVGYALRGQVDISTHLALWDVFSRRARFLTGTGVSDDHHAIDWRPLKNGFVTGIWSTSVGHASLMSALRAGRAYTSHVGLWPGAQLDLLVDGSVPMGKASVSSRTARALDILAVNLPRNSTVEIIRGPVDATGTEPGTTRLATISAAEFGTSALASRTVDTSASSFVRAQVRSSTGTVIGISNPVWLLRQVPPSGIPVPRRA